MNRRICIVFLLICFLMSLLAFPASAETYGTCGDNATWSLSDSGVLTISGTGAIRDYTYEGASVFVKAPWRSYSSQVKKIVIASGITSIGKNAFCCLPKVTSVSIPNTVTTIGQAAFCDCTSLTSITIPNGVKIIRDSVFLRCKALTSVTLPAGLEVLEGGTFENCGKLKSIKLPSGLTKIDAWTFGHCYSLTSVSIPEGITEIGSNAFAYCNSLTTIKLPNTLKKISTFAFYNTTLTQITIPKNTAEIRQDAFASCYSLKTVRFEGSAPIIDSHVFSSGTLTAYYPKDDSSWTEDVRKNYDGTITWVAYCGSGHNWGQWTTVRESSCAKDGLKARSCSQCDMKEEASIAKSPHQYTSVITKPTCRDKGFTTHTCQICKSSYVDSYVDAGPHVFGDWETITTATCLETGRRQHLCTVCQFIESEEIAIADHTYLDQVTEATCTQKGFTTHTCSVCGHITTDTHTDITAHSFGSWKETKAATIRREGQQRRQCVDCSETQTRTIPVLTVNWGIIIGITAGVFALASIAICIIVYKRKHSRK